MIYARRHNCRAISVNHKDLEDRKGDGREKAVACMRRPCGGRDSDAFAVFAVPKQVTNYVVMYRYRSSHPTYINYSALASQQASTACFRTIAANEHMDNSTAILSPRISLLGGKTDDIDYHRDLSERWGSFFGAWANTDGRRTHCPVSSPTVPAR
jgi:hypothetical protein